MPTVETTDNQRVAYLDGMRGIGAVQVCLLHMTTGLLGWTAPYGPELVFFDGQLAVFIFFLISGFVLTRAYERVSSSPATLITARSVRLFVPTVAACLFATVIALTSNFINGVNGWPTIGDALADTFLTIVAGHHSSSLFRNIPLLNEMLTNNDSHVNAPLWTIHVEFVGSILVVLLTSIKSQWRTLKIFVLATVTVITVRSLLFPFVVGYFLASTQFRFRSWLWPAALILLGTYISIAASNMDIFGWATSVSKIKWMISAQSSFSVQKCAAAILIFIAIVGYQPAHLWLSTKPMMILGAYSFPLYLVHFPVIIWIGQPLTQISLPLSIFGSLVIIAGATWAFRWVDTVAIYLSRRSRRQSRHNLAPSAQPKRLHDG